MFGPIARRPTLSAWEQVLQDAAAPPPGALQFADDPRGDEQEFAFSSIYVEAERKDREVGCRRYYWLGELFGRKGTVSNGCDEHEEGPDKPHTIGTLIVDHKLACNPARACNSARRCLFDAMRTTGKKAGPEMIEPLCAFAQKLWHGGRSPRGHDRVGIV